LQQTELHSQSIKSMHDYTVNKLTRINNVSLP